MQSDSAVTAWNMSRNNPAQLLPEELAGYYKKRRSITSCVPNADAAKEFSPVYIEVQKVDKNVRGRQASVEYG